MTTPESDRDDPYVPNGASGGDDAPAGAGPQDQSSLAKERDELKDQLLRSRAEFANYQKRARQQAEADREYAVGNLARDLLDALDNLERAAEALRASGQGGVSSGLEMVQKQILATLAKYKVEPIEALGQHFDPNFHEAIMQQPSPGVPEGTVVMDLSKGYKIHDRVLRPSKVAVSVKP
ncbi:nucleotide exchange factor GrpE [Aquisphaera insulae]|uniref:nucleotide exchange factor GrpE n=1 Tax=Aquisphaera insulae TaxID=2712864 RepID=UPI0013EB322F|nr:nucleotide exchange factor GrpE [Aquisphaera insulae]